MKPPLRSRIQAAWWILRGRGVVFNVSLLVWGDVVADNRKCLVSQCHLNWPSEQEIPPKFWDAAFNEITGGS